MDNASVNNELGDNALVSVNSENHHVSNDDASLALHSVKWIKYNDYKVPIVTQNINGPCPLLAIVNVLLLTQRIKLCDEIEYVSIDELMRNVGDCLLSELPTNYESEGVRCNAEQNVSDAIGIMSQLITGVDINVKFLTPSSFEYTPALVLFDLLSIRLYHGWVVDPGDVQLASVVNSYSYNQLVERAIEWTANSAPESLIVTQFLMSNQLTYHGICELSTAMDENEVAVFFRNNHFATICKRRGGIFQLVTDQGFVNKNDAVWETLSDVDGDCMFVNSQFNCESVPTQNEYESVDAQINSDFLLAMTMQENEQPSTSESSSHVKPSRERQMRTPSTPSSSASSENESKCTIL